MTKENTSDKPLDANHLLFPDYHKNQTDHPQVGVDITAESSRQVVSVPAHNTHIEQVVTSKESDLHKQIPEKKVSAQKTAIIIGAGIGGLATACLLSKKGYRVTVVEKNATVGGRASLITEGGFVFDKGPSWYLMPDVFEHFFSLMGEKIEDHLKLTRLTPSYRIFFKDENKIVDLKSDPIVDGRLFETLEPGASKKFEEYLEKSKYQYEVAYREFIFKNYDSIWDFLNIRMLTEGSKLSVLKKMHAYVSSFFKSDFIKKILEYQLVFLGSSPYNTPALYNIMTHIDFNMGVFYPMGGIFEVPKAMQKIAEKHGTTFTCNAPVRRIIVEQGIARGVELESGQTLHADIVISNADMEHTESKLLSPELRERSDAYWNKRTMAPSGFILYLGLSDKVPSLSHHNLIFSKDWERNFKQIFDTPQFPDDPSIYVCCPSKTDPLVAPPGKENIFVLVPIPAKLEYSDAELALYKEKIIRTLETHMDIPNLASRIEYEKVYCVKDFIKDYNSFGGTALGLAHTLRQTAIFRPNNYSKKVKGLYYVGAGTNPGIGMPMCLISAELVYKRLHNITSPEPLDSLD